MIRSNDPVEWSGRIIESNHRVESSSRIIESSNDPDAVNCYTEDGYTEEGVAAMKSLMMRANSGP
jgi:hypothetical protein